MWLPTPVNVISIHAPARGATSPVSHNPDQYKISTHAPARGATSGEARRRKANFNFNPRSREGSDCMPLTIFSFPYYFNPRSREGSDRSHCTYTTLRQQFQPTLPRGERPVSEIMGDQDPEISTHAPARGATVFGSNPEEFYQISTHAPARGATQTGAFSYQSALISTHAPARGATDPSAPEGSYLLFQPTLPRGERRSLVISQSAVAVISTHAPARGATLKGVYYNYRKGISTHAPARGATHAGQ